MLNKSNAVGEWNGDEFSEGVRNDYEPGKCRNHERVKAVEFSDYDILIIVSRPISWQQRRKIVDEVYVSDLKYNILTDVKVISELELKSLKGKQPFVQHALQEGVAA
ncbi:MAG: hypothetical protein JRI62_05145 [Deltaproteobacteria bacterium]|nr:hypothetical protein [Deltaproteobacteria bacterium]